MAGLLNPARHSEPLPPPSGASAGPPASGTHLRLGGVGGAATTIVGLKRWQGETSSTPRYAFANFFTLALFCAFAPATVILFQIGHDPDAAYWITGMGKFIVLLPIYLVFQHVAQLQRIRQGRPLPKLFFLIVVLVPAVFLVLFGAIYMYYSGYWYEQMVVPNCLGEGMQDVQASYDAAKELHDRCVQALTQANSDQPLEARPSLQSCEMWEDSSGSGTIMRNWRGYDASERKSVPGTFWTQDWYYLATVELNHQCAGFCVGGPPIWSFSHPTDYDSPCMQFVGHKMLVIRREGLMVLVLGSIIIGLAVPLWFLVRDNLEKLGHF